MRSFRPRPLRSSRSLIQAEILIRHYQIRRYFLNKSETRTIRTSSERAVERKHSRRKLLNTYIAVRACIILAEQHFFAVRLRHNYKSFPEVRCRFNRIGKSCFTSRPYYDSVYDYFYIMLFILFKLYFFFKFVYISVRTHSYISAFFGTLKYLYMLAFFAADNRRHYHNFRSLAERHNLVAYLIHCLLRDELSAFRAMRLSDTCIQKSQIIVNFRYRADRGTRVFACGFLVYGYCR